MIDTDLGHWSDGLHNLPSGDGKWVGAGRFTNNGGYYRRAWTYIVAEKVVAILRRHSNHGWHGWIARVEGFEWTITDDMNVARFRSIAGDQITHTVVKLFHTVKAAKAEIEYILGTKP